MEELRGGRCPIPVGRARETIIVAHPEASDRNFETLVDWYSQEDTWLNWALARCGHPPLIDLVKHEIDAT
jgi:hypothetical protein